MCMGGPRNQSTQSTMKAWFCASPSPVLMGLTAAFSDQGQATKLRRIMHCFSLDVGEAKLSFPQLGKACFPRRKYFVFTESSSLFLSLLLHLFNKKQFKHPLDPFSPNCPSWGGVFRVTQAFVCLFDFTFNLEWRIHCFMFFLLTPIAYICRFLLWKHIKFYPYL